MHFVYHLLDVDTVQYVGRTVNPTARHRDHERAHGRKFSLHVVLATEDFREAAARETAEIAAYEPPLNFSETSSPGRLGKPHTEETKALISAANKGRVKSEAWRAKLAAANSGRTMSEEARTKISAALKGRPISEASREALRKARTGAVASEETKAKMREAWARKKARGYANPNPMQPGSKHSDETRAKMRESHAKRLGK